MFGWLTKKLKAGRIAMSIAQLEHELEALTPDEIASVLVTAMEFSSAFAKEGADGAFITKAIEIPSTINEQDAYTLYWNLEEILMTGQKQNEQAYANAKGRLGFKFAENFRNDMKLMEIGLRLLLSRIAVSIDPGNKAKLQSIARRLDVGVPLIGEAMKKLRLQHSAIGTPKSEDHYASIDASARLYAFSYMASFYGNEQS